MLLDDITRHQIDEEMRVHEMSESVIINDLVSLSDCTLQGNEYCYQCRCGGTYTTDMVEQYRKQPCIVGCDTCSLHIKLLP